MFGHSFQLADVTCFNGNFYAVNKIGKVFRCELGLEEGSSAPKCVEFANTPPQFRRTELNFIVDLGGHPCMIGCNYGQYQYIKEDGEVEMEHINGEPQIAISFLTEAIKIVRLDMHSRIWESIFSLGDRSLFFGNCYSFSVLAADYLACTSNCIYFADNQSEFYNTTKGGGINTGIYNCANKKILRLPVGDDEQGFQSKFTPPLWILPTSQ
ncbi:hypothetical protein CCACVL1_24398 [Corchorus capsularis]|uniref:KIB1-4 beta-propeller domain-containing protein n=1 Tax=Corchorus capsularis TaxID=210143 RepID=A0A1R3GPS6_COCAP|nr:hypothetical protein CCACVL1_24398 [Corchorus capsularis]